MALPQWYVSTKDVLNDIWANAGTKVIGYGSIVIGVLGTLDASTIGIVEAHLPGWLAKDLPFICLACAGLLTRQRGARNTSDIADHIISRANAGDPAASNAVAAATGNAVAAADKVLLVKPPEKTS